MLRITCSEQNGRRVLDLEGRVAGEWVAELRRVALGSPKPSTALRLNLAGVIFADANGVLLLRELRSRGAELTECSEFIAALVSGGSECQP